MPENLPEMYFSDDSRLGRPFAKDPSVVRFGKLYYLYYSLPGSPESPAWGIGIATSKDLLNWTKVGEVLPEPGTVEESGICAPGARVIDGAVHLFYQTYGNGPADAICHATSTDGLTFVRNPTNPVFRPEGVWCCGRAIDAEVYPVGNRLLLYYATRDPEFNIQMLGVAMAQLTSGFGRGTWTDLSHKGPMLKPELPWEKNCIEAPTVMRRNETFFLFYAGGYNNEPQQIGLATSPDGVHWQRASDEPFLRSGAPGEWNSSESGHPGVFVDPRGKTYLFFQGNADDGQTWFLSRKLLAWTPENHPTTG